MPDFLAAPRDAVLERPESGGQNATFVQLPGEDTLMREEGSQLIIKPVSAMSLLALLAALEPIEDELPDISELPLDDIEL